MEHCNYQQQVMRKVEFKENVNDDYSRGYFHQWGKSILESNEDGMCEYTVGIVEDDKGNIYLIHPPYIKFLD